MANTAAVYARIDPKLKSEVDEILSELGVTPSSLIQMLYNQIRITKSIPFALTLVRKPLVLEEMTKEEFDREMQKAEDDIKNGRVVSSKEVDEYFKNKYGIK